MSIKQSRSATTLSSHTRKLFKKRLKISNIFKSKQLADESQASIVNSRFNHRRSQTCTGLPVTKSSLNEIELEVKAKMLKIPNDDDSKRFKVHQEAFLKLIASDPHNSSLLLRIKNEYERFIKNTENSARKPLQKKINAYRNILKELSVSKDKENIIDLFKDSRPITRIKKGKRIHRKMFSFRPPT